MTHGCVMGRAVGPHPVFCPLKIGSQITACCELTATEPPPHFPGGVLLRGVSGTAPSKRGWDRLV